ncbi:hypothetical protein D3C85_1218680 [compost metagenome]
MHAQLRGVDRQLLQRIQLVTGARGRVGEAGGHLVLPGAGGEHGLRRRVHERLELRRGATHIGGRAEDDRVDRFQVLPVRVDLLHGNQHAPYPHDTACARVHGFRLSARVAISAVVHHRDAYCVIHACFSLKTSMRAGIAACFRTCFDGNFGPMCRK